MAIVANGEMGRRWEQVMVTPISTPAFILPGKTIPVRHPRVRGDVAALAVGISGSASPSPVPGCLLYGLSLVFLFTTLGMGMFISTVTSTSSRRCFFAWFFAIFAIMTSGFFTPDRQHARFVQYMTYLNPLRFYMRIVRGIMMKGAGVDTLYREYYRHGCLQHRHLFLRLDAVFQTARLAAPARQS